MGTERESELGGGAEVERLMGNVKSVRNGRLCYWVSGRKQGEIKRPALQ